MNLGQLEEENEKFINNYKAMGYSTKTQLANEAFRLLRREKARAARRRWLNDAFREMEQVERDIAFEPIEGDAFVDKEG